MTNKHTASPVPSQSTLAYLILVLLLWLSAGFNFAATHTWTGAGGNSLFSNPANWSGGNVPANSTNWVELQFPAAGTTQAIVDLQNLSVDHIAIQRTNFTLLGTNGWPLTFGDSTYPGTVETFGGTTVFGSSLRLAFPHGVTLSATGQVQLLGWLQGPGYLTKDGPADIVIGGLTGNTHTNITVINDGNLWLAKPAGVMAILGGLRKVGGEILLTNSHQIHSNALVELSSATFLGGAYQQILGNLKIGYDSFIRSATGGGITLGNLQFFNSFSALWIQGNGGTITLGGPVSLGRDTETYLSGNLVLAAPGVTFSLDATGTQGDLPFIQFTGNVSGPTNAPLRFAGEGDVELINNGSTYQGALYIQTNVTAHMKSADALGSSVGGTYVSEYAELSIEGPYTLLEPLHFTGPYLATNQFSLSTMIRADAVGVNLAGPIRLTNTVNVYVGVTNGFSISGAIAGPGGLTKHDLGGGPLVFSGTAINTFSGGLTILREGSVEMRRVNGGLSVPGPLILYQGAEARCYFNHQIGDNAIVQTINGAALRLLDVSDTIGGLDLHEGNVLTGTGTLTVLSNITTRPAAVESFISGNLALGDGGVTVHVEPGGLFPDLLVPATISGGAFAPLIKTGGGQLDLVGTNTFFGAAFVNEGTLRARNSLALGATTLGTTVSSKAVLDFNSVFPIHGESLSLLDGTLRLTQPVTNTWGGPVVLGGDAVIESLYANSRLVLTNVVSGSGGFAKTGIGILDLAGVSANTFAGSTYVSGGVLNLNKTNGPAVSGLALNIGVIPRSPAPAAASVESLRAAQVADSTAISLSSLGVWDLNGFNDTVGSLAGAGQVLLGAAQLTQGGLGSDTAFSGQITGNGTISLVKVGGGTFTMSGVQTYTGRTTVSGGTLLVNGTNGPGLTTLASGTLGGRGQIANVTATAGTISPGSSPGVLKTGNLVWGPNVTYRCELNNTNVGTGYDQLSVTGTVSIGSAQLQLALGNPGAISNRYTILLNDAADAVTGTFSGLAEGATFYASGTPFRITYQGGTGNDVVLTQIGFQQKPQLGSVKQLPNGQIEINGTGIPNLLYSVYASTNVAESVTGWLDLGLIQATPGGALQFVDPDATNYTRRFYQFALPPYNQ